MPDLNEFSLKILEIIGPDGEKKTSKAELNKLVPKIRELVDKHLYNGTMQNKKIRWVET